MRGRCAMKKILIASTIAAAGTFAMPALADETMTKSDVDFFYAEIEGGYAFFDGVELVGPTATLEPEGGAYGTVTLGHVSIDDGIIGGYVDRAELWVSYFDNGDDSASGGGVSATIERDYWDIGVRFQHYYDQNATDKMMWGLEPFILLGSASVVQTGILNARAEGDTTLYAAMLSFESEHMIAPSTMLLLRAAGGVYGSSADIAGTGGLVFNDSNTSAGFRGQLAVGLKQQLTPRTSIGATARLDYFSDMPSTDPATGHQTLTTDELLNVSVGVNLNYIFGGTYQ